MTPTDAAIAQAFRETNTGLDSALDFAGKVVRRARELDAKPEQVHTCSYYCDRPGCVKDQRDELRDRLEGLDAEKGGDAPISAGDLTFLRGLADLWDSVSAGDPECPNAERDPGIDFCVTELRSACDIIAKLSARTTPPAQAAEAVDAEDGHAMNTQLCGFGMRWRLDGDYLRCKKCDRPQLASRAHDAFKHADGCKNGLGAERHPWREFIRITAPINRAAIAAMQAGEAGGV